MKRLEENQQDKGHVNEVIQQERVICTVAADLLVMNKLLEDVNSKSTTAKKESPSKTVLAVIKTKIKRLFQ